MKTIGKRLRELRTERGLTQQGLAARIEGGMDYTYIGKIERGEQQPSLKVLTKLGAALQVPLSRLFGEDPGGGPEPLAHSALPKGEAGRELLRALRQLHPEDVPLVVEIVKVLNRHRRTGARSAEGTEGGLRAAEEEDPYGTE